MAVHRVQNREELHIGGDWRTPDDYIEVTDLAEGGEFARVAAATPSDAADALEAAKRAEPALRQMTVVERTEWLEGIADGIESRADELAEIIVREAGKPISSARGEVESAAERFRHPSWPSVVPST